MNRIALQITRHCLLVVTFAEMTKTHLEHQLIRFKQNKYGNATTSKYDPYANYDPQEGITTAIILGSALLLIITYIAFKMGWRKVQKRLCYKQGRADSQTPYDLEQMLPSLNIQQQCIPIIVQDENGCQAQNSVYGSTRMETEEGNTNLPTIHTPSEAVHRILTPGTESSQQRERLENFTMVLNPNQVQKIASKLSVSKQSGKMHNKSGGSSPNKPSADRLSSKSDQLYQQLPPPANQVLRTAQWVNTVNYELSNPAAYQSQELHSPTSVTLAEINHHKSPTVSPVSHNQHIKKQVPSPVQSLKKVDLATSEV